MSRDKGVVIECVLEGSTEGTGDSSPQPPNRGVLPILVYKLCGKPRDMKVVGRPFDFLQGKGLRQKIRFARQRAKNAESSGMVFVLDSEGTSKDREGKLKELERGRTRGAAIPTAIGVAQPCIESWLLCDSPAIRRALALSKSPVLPDDPESLPAPCKDRRRNPKTLLAEVGGVAKRKKELSTSEKDQIAEALNDLSLLCDKCPVSFAPFAEEVKKEIKPLFAG